MSDQLRRKAATALKLANDTADPGARKALCLAAARYLEEADELLRASAAAKAAAIARKPAV
jgi:hypothetical protein